MRATNGTKRYIENLKISRFGPPMVIGEESKYLPWTELEAGEPGRYQFFRIEMSAWTVLQPLFFYDDTMSL